MTANNRLSKETYTSAKELKKIRKRALYIRKKAQEHSISAATSIIPQHDCKQPHVKRDLHIHKRAPKNPQKSPIYSHKKVKSSIFLLPPLLSRNMTANNRMSKETYISAKEPYKSE